jgi:hypothetical protein
LRVRWFECKRYELHPVFLRIGVFTCIVRSCVGGSASAVPQGLLNLVRREFAEVFQVTGHKRAIPPKRAMRLDGCESSPDLLPEYRNG